MNISPRVDPWPSSPSSFTPLRKPNKAPKILPPPISPSQIRSKKHARCISSPSVLTLPFKQNRSLEISSAHNTPTEDSAISSPLPIFTVPDLKITPATPLRSFFRLSRETVKPLSISSLREEVAGSSGDAGTDALLAESRRKIEDARKAERERAEALRLQPLMDATKSKSKKPDEAKGEDGKEDEGEKPDRTLEAIRLLRTISAAFEGLMYEVQAGAKERQVKGVDEQKEDWEKWKGSQGKGRGCRLERGERGEIKGLKQVLGFVNGIADRVEDIVQSQDARTA